MVKRVELLAKGESVLLGRYQLIGSLASGGMATVYLARLAGVGGFQRMVAIKRLHPHLATEDEFVEMFVDEARLAASIHHQNVVPILEIEQSEDGYYLVMEYIEGVTLARLMTHVALAQNKIEVPLLLRMIIDTLNGLHAAHELVDESGHYLNVVHRDCTPQNILVGLDGCTRITDFGVARARSRLANTRDGAMKGKLAYMAPEQAHGETMDRRADLFSVATVAWEGLTGRRLFKRKTDPATLKRVLQGPIPRVSDVVSIHAEIDRVIAKGLERDVDKRWSTAAEFADAFEAAGRAWGEAEGIDEPIATNRTVATMMKERYGAEVAAQRDDVNLWLKSTPSNAGVPPPRGTLRGLPRMDPAGDEATVMYESSASAPATSISSSGTYADLTGASAQGFPVRAVLGVAFLLVGGSMIVLDQKGEAPEPSPAVGVRSAAGGSAVPVASQASPKPAASAVDAKSLQAPAVSSAKEAVPAEKRAPDAKPVPRPVKKKAPVVPIAPTKPVKPAAPVAPAPTPEPAKPPVPVPPPKPKPAVEDDLSNPYR